jgi:hypothetical protein
VEVAVTALAGAEGAGAGIHGLTGARGSRVTLHAAHQPRVTVTIAGAVAPLPGARDRTLRYRHTPAIAIEDRHLIQAAHQSRIAGVGIGGTLVARTAFPGAPPGLGRNTGPGVFAGPGTDEPRIARVVQRATREASWVTVQLARTAFPGATIRLTGAFAATADV